MEEDIKKILALAAHAPSGENCQPWKFKVNSNVVSIYNLPERDSSLYSWGQRSSYVAHGALIENFSIAAKELGYQTKVSLFPDPTQKELVTNIELENAVTAKDPLFKYITLRCTNRKPYKSQTLTEEQLRLLRSAAENSAGVRVSFITASGKIQQLSQHTCLNEQLVFENPSIHEFFFKHITWTEQENEQKSVGFYIKTLELPPPAQAMFKLIKYWPVLNLLNKIGFSKTVAKENAKTHAACACQILISIPSEDKENFIAAGRALQRLWLTATSLGISAQPLTGILYLYLKVKAGENDGLSTGQIELIKKANKKIAEIFELSDYTAAMYLRLGFADHPSAQATRLPLEQSLA